jgi:hypothetical protein
MDERVERRGPDRQRFVLRLLRRLAAAALLLAFAIWAAPRLLVEAGLLGPTAAERVDEAARAVAIARAYGATDGPALRAAEAELARARERAAAGDERDARRAAQAATAAAIEAQRAALVARSGRAARAEAAYGDLEREINALEKLYGEVTPGLPRARVSELLSAMKATRQATGAVFLAYEQKDYGTVLAREGRAREAVAAMRRALEAARR